MNNNRLLFWQNQRLLLSLANSEAGRHLLGIKDHSPIVKITPNSTHAFQGLKNKDEGIFKGTFFTDDRIAQKLLPILAKIEIANEYKRIENIDRAFLHYAGLERGRFPQIFLTTDPFNAGAGTGATNIQNQSSWANARGGTTATQLLSTPSILSWRVAANSWYLIRAHIPFNTASLDDAADVTGLVLKLYRTGDFTNTDTCTLHVVPSTQTDPTADPVAADFDNISFNSKGSILYSDIGTGAYEEITVNVDQINLTGYTKLALIDNRDLNNSAPTGRNDVNFESDGAANPPILEVTYSSSQIKKLGGIAYEDIKKVGGIAIGDIKKIGGIQ